MAGPNVSFIQRFTCILNENNKLTFGRGSNNPPNKTITNNIKNEEMNPTICTTKEPFI